MSMFNLSFNIRNSGALLFRRMIVILHAVSEISNSCGASLSRWIICCCWECRYSSWVSRFEEEREHGRFGMLERKSSDCWLFWKKLY